MICGSYVMDICRFVVVGLMLYELIFGVVVLCGMLFISSGYVCMKYGCDQLVIVDGVNGYVFNLSINVFLIIIDVDWCGFNWVDELDGYFIFFDLGMDQFYLLFIDDVIMLDVFDFSGVDVVLDDIMMYCVMKCELYFMGLCFIEVWINSGDVDFLFMCYNLMFIDIGVCG